MYPCYKLVLICIFFRYVKESMSSYGIGLKAGGQIIGTDLTQSFTSCFFLSVFLRFALQKDDFSWAQIMYSITLALFILRSLQFFYVAKNTGPKIIMLGKMVSKIGWIPITQVMILLRTCIFELILRLLS